MAPQPSGTFGKNGSTFLKWSHFILNNHQSCCRQSVATVSRHSRKSRLSTHYSPLSTHFLSRNCQKHVRKSPKDRLFCHVAALIAFSTVDRQMSVATTALIIIFEDPSFEEVELKWLLSHNQPFLIFLFFWQKTVPLCKVVQKRYLIGGHPVDMKMAPLFSFSACIPIFVTCRAMP